MSAEITDELRAARSRAGTLGSASRWGPRKHIKLDTLDPAVQRAIRALVAADEAARKEAATTDENVVTAREARRVRDELPTAS